VNPALMDLLGALAALQDRLGVEMRFRGFVKAELFTAPMAAAMHRAGFRWLLCGFEAAHPRILRNIRKRATVADNTRVLEFASRHGLKVKALMSLGHPGEDEDTVRAVDDWLRETAPADFDCTVITPYPGSPYYDGAKRNGDFWTYEVDGDRLHSVDVDYGTTADYYKGIPGQYRSYVWTDALRPETLTALRDEIETRCRAALGLAPPDIAAVQFEHSMGMA